MDHNQDPVTALYEKWSYPAPVLDLSGDRRLSDPSISGLRYWPRRHNFDNLSILVAGCGTSEAASFAFNNPTSRVLGIDISEASLRHTEWLKQKYGLANLTVLKFDLRSAAELGQTFDLISCSGVLHHLPDPSVGLAALRDVLQPDGALSVMVYSQVGRAGVYLLQDAFRRLGLTPSVENIAVARAILSALPAEHPARGYLKAFADQMADDTAIVDAFLHPVDRAYTIPELMRWIMQNGLVFMGWVEPLLHSPTAMLGDSPAVPLVAQLPPEQRWATLELLAGIAPPLQFISCRQDRPPEDYTIPFDREAFLECVPTWSGAIEILQTPGKPVILRRRNFDLTITPGLGRLTAPIDGARTVRDIVAMSSAALAETKATFLQLYEWGYLLFRIP